MTETSNRKTRRAEAADVARMPWKLWLVSALCQVQNGPMVIRHILTMARTEKEARNDFAGKMLEEQTPCVMIVVDEQQGMQRDPTWRPATAPPAQPAGPGALIDPLAAVVSQGRIKTPLVPPSADDDADGGSTQEGDV